MFRDLKEYQQIQKIYEEKICLTEEDKIVEEIINETFSEDEIEFILENLQEIVSEDESEDLEEQLSRFVGGLTKMARGGTGLSKFASKITPRVRQVSFNNMRTSPILNKFGKPLQINTKVGSTSTGPGMADKFKSFTSNLKDRASKIRSKFDRKITTTKTSSTLKDPKGAPLKTTTTKVVNPINKRNAAVAGTALVGAGVAAGLAGRKNTTTTGGGTDAEGKKIPSTAEIRAKAAEKRGGTPAIGGGNAGASTDSGGTQGKGGVETKPTTTAPQKKMSSIEKKNRARFGDKRIDMLKAKNKDFQAMKKGGMSKDDFIKKYPKSITAQRAAGLRDHKEVDAYDMVLEYLMSTQQVATIEEANYVMIEMDAKTIQSIVEEQKKNLDEKFNLGKVRILPALIKGGAAVIGTKMIASKLGQQSGQNQITPPVVPSTTKTKKEDNKKYENPDDGSIPGRYKDESLRDYNIRRNRGLQDAINKS